MLRLELYCSTVVFSSAKVVEADMQSDNSKDWIEMWTKSDDCLINTLYLLHLTNSLWFSLHTLLDVTLVWHRRICGVLISSHSM